MPIKEQSEYIKKLHADLKICAKVKATIDSEGWKDIIQPLIEKSIIDIVGGKIGDEWVGGLLNRAKKEEKREFYIGYKQALIDLHKRIMNYVKQITLKEKEIKNLLDNTDKEIMPMQDSPYMPEEAIQ